MGGGGVAVDVAAALSLSLFSTISHNEHTHKHTHKQTHSQGILHLEQLKLSWFHMQLRGGGIKREGGRGERESKNKRARA